MNLYYIESFTYRYSKFLTHSKRITNYKDINFLYEMAANTRNEQLKYIYNSLYFYCRKNI